MEGIKTLNSNIALNQSGKTQQETALELWRNKLDPLIYEGTEILTPINSLQRNTVKKNKAAQKKTPYENQYGLDSGTLTPRTFQNGLTIDIAQAAIGSIPTELGLHRKRTAISTIYSNNENLYIKNQDMSLDNEYFNGRIIQIKTELSQGETDATSSIALYTAESEHLLNNISNIQDFLFIDGPIYPVRLLRWRDIQDMMLFDSKITLNIFRNYTNIVDKLLEKNTPYIGFVKNYRSRIVVNRISTEQSCPWNRDAGFFRAVLDSEVEMDEISYTNWFVSKLNVEKGEGTHAVEWTRNPEHEDSEVYYTSYMLIYEPRSGFVFKAEAPFGFTKQDDIRESMTDLLLKEVALNGVPRAISRADELARIPIGEKDAIVESLEEQFRTGVEPDYDEERWGSGL